MVYCLGLLTFIARGLSSISSPGTKIPHASWPKKKEEEERNILHQLASHIQHACSVTCDSLQPYGLCLPRLLCPWDFSRQEYWNGLPFPTPGSLPNPEFKPTSLASPELAGRFSTTALAEKPL